MKNSKDLLSPLFSTIAKASITAGLFGLLVAACSPPSPKLMPKPTRHNQATTPAGDFNISFNPKVDILFVIDNSASMLDAQLALSHNINQFADVFSKNDIIDFHIGVLNVFDSERQKPGTPFFWPNGQLRPVLTTVSTESVPSETLSTCKNTTDITAIKDVSQLPAERFISRATPNFPEALKASLMVGVRCLEKVGGGPEFEELFSPVYNALQEPMLSGPNRGFYRDDAMLVVILISDANPSVKDVNANVLANFLRNLKAPQLARQEQEFPGQSHIKNWLATYAVHFPVGQKECVSPFNGSHKIQRDYGDVDPIRTLDFLKMTHENQDDFESSDFSLCDKNYGANLGKIGQHIQKYVLQKTIHLKDIPQWDPSTSGVSSIQIRYGSQVIPPTQRPGDGGWAFDSKTNTITIPPEVRIRPEAGAQLTVNFIPVTNDRIKKGKVRRLDY